MSSNKALSEWYETSRKCIRCGICRGVCPVFDVVGTEPSASRGKVQLIRALLEQRLDPTQTLKQLVSLCLNCGTCAANCPSGIQVHEMILSARAELLSQLGQPQMERLLLRGLAGDSARMSYGAKATALYQKTGLRWLAHKTKLLNVLPGDLETREEFVPDLPLRSTRSKIRRVPTPADPKMRVVYFLGCTTNLLEPSVGMALVQVLSQSRCQVVVPPRLECCGMPHRNYGDVETAARLEQANVSYLNFAKADAIVVDCATCGSTIKRYAGLNAPVYDIAELLTDILQLDATSAGGSRTKVTYHDPCHLVRGQSLGASPRQLLRSTNGVELVELPEADHCCGGGGSFNLTHFETSMAILDRKVENILSTGADVVATGCPGCRMQIRYGLKRRANQSGPSRERTRSVIPRDVLHPIELLARGMKNKP